MPNKHTDSKQDTTADIRWLSFMLDSAEFTIISTDCDGIIRSFNHDAVERLGYQPDELIGKHTPAIIHDQNEVIARAAQLSKELGQDIQPGFEVFVVKARMGIADENEWTYIRKDGSTFSVLLSITALKDEQDNIEGFLGIGRDISIHKAMESQIQQQQIELARANQELREANARLKEITQIDPLTELLNRRGLYVRLEQELERIKRHAEPLSMLLLDIDYFKRYNDQYGHLEGDRLLKELSGLLRKHTRAIDSVARFGGEEFLFLLPQTDMETSIQIAERYRALIEEMDFDNHSITASFGVSTMNSLPKDATAATMFDRLMEQADKAMYFSKEHGRNQVKHFNNLD